MVVVRGISTSLKTNLTNELPQCSLKAFLLVKPLPREQACYETNRYGPGPWEVWGTNSGSFCGAVEGRGQVGWVETKAEY